MESSQNSFKEIVAHTQRLNPTRSFEEIEEMVLYQFKFVVHHVALDTRKPILLAFLGTFYTGKKRRQFIKVSKEWKEYKEKQTQGIEGLTQPEQLWKPKV